MADARGFAEFLEAWARSGRTFVRLIQNNALNPIAFLTFPGLGMLVFATIFMKGGPELRPLVWVLAVVGVLPLVVALAVGIYFALKKPEMLRTEKFVLEEHRLTIQQQGLAARIVTTETLKPLDNPAAGQLPAPEEG